MTDSTSRAQQKARTAGLILEVARHRFASDGYDGTSIRAIAAEAGIDAALVMRYFGSKDGLFSAATEIDLEMSDFSDTPRQDLGAALAQHFVERWEATDTGVPLRILLTAAPKDTAAAEKMKTVFEQQLLPVIAHAVPGDSNGDAVPAKRAALIASHVLGFAFCRYVLKLPAIVAMDEAEATTWLGPAIQRCLEGGIAPLRR
ncbi:TetR family transcriptional regulator [Frondihabitans sucicola]|uniref:TetR family transcriptional regulator n=1 Tax=Frondihabitans sucicola TaxID=1268041 RepID=A0ABN6XUL5_9MICO|nr:TetR family transcriptional regulator [Frondihabitans sucicola]BDZ48719.1 TetR family transcriptional regulator [Frondihabitans sucicola]